MTFDEYQEETQRTAAEVTNTNYPSQLIMCGLGITGEAGEVADEIKKHMFHGHGLKKEHLMKEMGDVLWYMGHLCRVLGVSLDEVAKMNIAKLKARYPNGFDVERSLNRTEEG